MKMISSTSITSMNGVTLISWTSSRSALPWSRRTLMAPPPSLGGGRQRRAAERAAVEIAAHQPQHLGRGVAELRAVAGDRAREDVVDHHRRDRGREPEGG